MLVLPVRSVVRLSTPYLSLLFRPWQLSLWLLLWLSSWLSL